MRQLEQSIIYSHFGRSALGCQAHESTVVGLVVRSAGPTARPGTLASLLLVAIHQVWPGASRGPGGPPYTASNKNSEITHHRRAPFVALRRRRAVLRSKWVRLVGQKHLVLFALDLRNGFVR